MLGYRGRNVIAVPRLLKAIPTRLVTKASSLCKPILALLSSTNLSFPKHLYDVKSSCRVLLSQAGNGEIVRVSSCISLNAITGSTYPHTAPYRPRRFYMQLTLSHASGRGESIFKGLNPHCRSCFALLYFIQSGKSDHAYECAT